MRADRPNFGPCRARLTRPTAVSRFGAAVARVGDRNGWISTRHDEKTAERLGPSNFYPMKDVDMSASVAIADWIKRIADDERSRDTVRVREDEIAARKADLVRRNGRRLVDELRAAVTRDVADFRDEFAGD